MQIIDSDSSDEFQDAVESIEPSTLLINAAKTKPNLSPGDIQNVLSSSQDRQAKPPKPKLETNVHERMTYSVSAHRKVNSNHGALVDRGANGGLVGSDVRIIVCTD